MSFLCRKNIWKRSVSPSLEFLSSRTGVLGLLTGPNGIGKTLYVQHKLASLDHVYISLANTQSKKRLKEELFSKITQPLPLVLDDAHLLFRWPEQWLFHILENSEYNRNILLIGSEPMRRRFHLFTNSLLVLPTPQVDPAAVALPYNILEKCGMNFSDLRYVYKKIHGTPEDGLQALLTLSKVQIVETLQKQSFITPIVLKAILDILRLGPIQRSYLSVILHNIVSRNKCERAVSYLLDHKVLWEEDYGESVLTFQRPILRYAWEDLRKTYCAESDS